MIPHHARFPLASLGLGLLSLGASAQSVHVVDGAGGPGAEFTTIADAVAAASPGDVVLVRSGSYAEPIALVGKGLVVHAEAGAAVEATSLSISSLPAGSFAAVRGIAFTSTGRAISVSSCDGRVWLEEVSADAQTALFVHDAPHVVLRDASLVGRSITPAATSAVESASAALSLFGCDVQGGAGVPGLPTPGQDGLWIGMLSLFGITGTVDAWLYGSSVLAGPGGDGGSTGLGPGGDGAFVTASAVVDVLGSDVLGAAGSPPGLPFRTGSGSVVTWPDAARAIFVPSPLREAEQAAVVHTGEPGDLVWDLFAEDPGPQVAGRSWRGPFVLGTRAGQSFLGALDATGTETTQVTAPPLGGGAEAFVLLVQPLMRDAPTSRFVTGAPSLFVLLDADAVPVP